MRRASSFRPTTTCPTVRALCSEHNVLMIADEIQSGLARTRLHVRLRPLGRRAGCLPARQGAGRRRGSAVGGCRRPRDPRRAASRRARLDVRRQPVGRRDRHHGGFHAGAAENSRPARRNWARTCIARLRDLIGDGVVAVRGLGLWAGVDIEPALATGKEMSLRLADRGVLVKDTHGSTLRFAPPLVITEQEIDWAVDQFAVALREAAHNQLIRAQGAQLPASSISLTEQMLRRRPVVGAPVAHGAADHLKRSIGTFQLTMFGVGSTIGTGIFFVLSQAVPEAGPGVIVSFLIAGHRGRARGHLLRRIGFRGTGFGFVVLVRVHHAG